MMMMMMMMMMIIIIILTLSKPSLLTRTLRNRVQRIFLSMKAMVLIALRLKLWPISSKMPLTSSATDSIATPLSSAFWNQNIMQLNNHAEYLWKNKKRKSLWKVLKKSPWKKENPHERQTNPFNKKNYFLLDNLTRDEWKPPNQDLWPSITGP